MQTDPTEFYNECLKTKLAFYKWPQWITDNMKRKMWRERNNPNVAHLLKIMEAEGESDAILGENINFNAKHF